MRRADLLRTTLFCLTALAAAPVSAQPPIAAYTPPSGTAERAAIMDSIRLTQFADRYKVSHLVVMRSAPGPSSPSRSVVIAEVSDASGTSETGGIFLLKGINQQWRAEYMVDGSGGQADCSGARKIHQSMIAEVTEFGFDPRAVMPESFWRSLKEAEKGGEDGHCMVAKAW